VTISAATKPIKCVIDKPMPLFDPLDTPRGQTTGELGNPFSTARVSIVAGNARRPIRLPPKHDANGSYCISSEEVPVSQWISLLTLGAISLPLMGCRDNEPPVPRTPPPAPGYEVGPREYERPKPMPPQHEAGAAFPQPFEDEPLLIDNPPEAKRFVEIYRKVGQPRILVFVNRTLEGQMVPPSGGGGGARARSNERGERAGEFLKPSEYDRELRSRPIDFALFETLLTDWISADNQVTVISPTMARKKLTDEQIKNLEAGRPQVLSELARQLDADILIQVQAHATRQTHDGLELRIVGEAINIQGGESLARGGVDMLPPLEKTQMNRYTRFLARKLMDGMSASWSAPPAPQGDAAAPEKPEVPKSEPLIPRRDPNNP
jgi:hypothetical protein